MAAQLSPQGPELPERIGRYDVLGLLGTGSFATVLRARDHSLDSDVAIKLLAENHAHDVDIRARFIDEGRALRRIEHPNIVRVFDIGEHLGSPYLVLELIDGGSLADLGPGAIPTRQLINELAGGLDAVHAAGFVHRDITPNNLLVRPSGSIAIADFGIAKDLSASRVTIAGGTAAFMAPEQRTPGVALDGRADLFAASAVIEWATPDVGASLQSELRRGMSDDPDGRHTSAIDWRNSLLVAADAAPAVNRQRKRLVFSGLMLAALALVGVLGWVAVSNLDSPNTERPTATGEPEGPDIIGPDQILLGDPATFDHTAVPGRTYRWIAPDGATTVGETVTFVPMTNDNFEIILIEADGDEERRSIRVVEVRTQ